MGCSLEDSPGASQRTELEGRRDLLTRALPLQDKRKEQATLPGPILLQEALQTLLQEERYHHPPQHKLAHLADPGRFNQTLRLL